MSVKNKELLVRILMAVLCIGMISIVLLGNESDYGVILRRGTSYQENDDLKPTITAFDGYAGVEKTYQIRISNIQPWGEGIFVYLVHQYAEVWLDDTLVAVSEEQPGWHLGSTPGCYWLSIPVAESDSGKQLKIITRPIYGSVVDRNPRVILSDWESTISVLIHRTLGQLIMSSICVIAGLVFVLLSPLIQLKQIEKKRLSYLGAFTFCVGMWRLCDLPLTSLLFPEFSRLLYYQVMLGLIMAPVFFTGFMYLGSEELDQRLYYVLNRALMIEAITVVLLQLFNLVDFRQVLNCLLVAAFVVLATIFLRSVKNIFVYKKEHRFLTYDVIYLAFVFGACIDIYLYLRLRSSSYLSLTLCITVLHLLVVGVSVIRQSMEENLHVYHTETELMRERERIMLSQIQPHFIFNSLSVIRELCHIDPEKAEDATVKFSQYLRSNMDSLSREGSISFADELQHVRNYLELEQLRFGDALQVEYDLQTERFRLPALTLQPIVENAVRHGVRKRVDGGVVRIHTEENEDAYVITVGDNGPGFSHSEAVGTGREQIGLKNVRNRLHQICEGSLEIESEMGVGTTVIIRIPKERRKNADLYHR